VKLTVPTLTRNISVVLTGTGWFNTPN